MPSFKDTVLTQTFTTTLQNQHTYAIKWARLGDTANLPLIFIHGEPWSSRLWAPFALAFPKIFSVYLFDNPGYGESVEIVNDKDSIKDVSLAIQGEAFASLLSHSSSNRRMSSPTITVAWSPYAQARPQRCVRQPMSHRCAGTDTMGVAFLLAHPRTRTSLRADQSTNLRGDAPSIYSAGCVQADSNGTGG